MGNEIVPGIHRIEAPLGDRVVCVFVLVGERGTLLIDTGLDAIIPDYVVPYLARLGLAPGHVRYVLTTHADMDHMGGNAAMRARAPHALFMCHRLDQVWIEDVEKLIGENYGQFKDSHGVADDQGTNDWIRSAAKGTAMDMGLSGGERLSLGTDWWLEIWHTPGHTRGHVSVFDPRSRTMIIADAALYNGLYTANGAPAFPPTYRFVNAYVSTIQRLQAAPIETLLTSHYQVKRGAEVREFLAESLAFVNRLDTAVQQVIQSAGGAISMKHVLDRLDGNVGGWPSSANSLLIYPVAGHVERLLESGLIQAAQSEGVTVYTWQKSD